MDTEEVRRLYWDEIKSAREIASIYSTTASTIYSFMRRNHIPRRSKPEAMKLTFASGDRKPRPAATSPRRAVLVCRGCGAEWKNEAEQQIVPCPFCGKTKDSRLRPYAEGDQQKKAARKERLREWYANAEKRQARGKRSRALTRKRLFFKIAGSILPRCARCGCNDARLLEINHKNGGGGKEMQKGLASMTFYRRILKGERGVDDLELLCKPCNAIHYLELKFGLLPMRVVWEAEDAL